MAREQLIQLNRTRCEEFIESLNKEFDSEKMREDRRNIYKKFRPGKTQPPRITSQDLERMERVWNYLDAIGFLMIENEQLREKGLKIWSYNFNRCWLCMKRYIEEERKKRKNDFFMEYFEGLYKQSRNYLKEERGINPDNIGWY